MNKIFKVVWSKTKECYVVVSEVAKNNGGKKKVLASVLAGLAMVGAGAQMGTPVQAEVKLNNSAVNIQPDGLPNNEKNSVGKNSTVVGYANTTNDQKGTVAYGGFNTATGNSSTALGSSNTATGGSATAIGSNTVASGDASVALGNLSQATNKGAIAIGTRTNYETTNTATGDGHGLTAGEYSTTVGGWSRATGKNASAFGYTAQATGDYSISVGVDTEATKNNSIAIGRMSKATNTSAVAVGVNNKAAGQDSTSVGSSNTVNGDQSSAFGRENVIDGASVAGAVAVGYKNKASGDRAIAIGEENESKEADTITMGNKNTANTGGGIAIGKGNTANSTAGGGSAGINSQIAIGRDNQAVDEDTLAVGRENKATERLAMAIGNRTEATGVGSIAIGSNGAPDGSGLVPKTISSGTFSVALGAQTKSTGTASVAVGGLASATATSATAVGHGATANEQAAVAVGKNATVNEQATTSTYTYSGTGGAVVGGVNTSTKTIHKGTGTDSATDIYNSGEEVAIGSGATVSDESNAAVVIGKGAKTEGNAHYSVVVGKGSYANASDGVVVGQDSYVKARESVAIGQGANVSNAGSVRSQAIGFGATISGANAYDALALGSSAQVTGVTGGVALGSGSSVSRTTASNENVGFNSKFVDGTKVRNRAYTADLTGNNDQWDSGSINTGAVSVGNDTQKRQIINVAAGNQDTDAVNVAQLKNVGVRVGADTNTATIGTNKVAADFLAYNGQLNIKGDNNRVTTVSENDANGKDANVNVKFDYDGLVKAKAGSSVTVNQKTEGGKTVFEIDAAAGGATSTEKVQAKADVAGSSDKNIAKVAPKAGENFGDVGATYEVNVSRNDVKDAAREAVTVNNGGTTKADGSYTADSNNPISVTPTKDDTNHNTSYAVTFDGAKAAKVIPLTYKANGAGDKTVTLEKGLDFTNGTNTTAEIGNDGVVKYNLNKDVDLTKDGSLTIGGTKLDNNTVTVSDADGISSTSMSTRQISVAGTDGSSTLAAANLVLERVDDGSTSLVDTHGITAEAGGRTVSFTTDDISAGDQIIHNVKEGVADTDAVNVKQLKENKAKLVDGKNTTVEGDGSKDSPYKVNVKGDLADISSITNGAGSGKISFAGDQVVKVDGDNPISLDGKGGYVTGLQNKDWDITNPTVVSGRAATEDQLKKVSDGFNNTVKLTGNSGATGTQKLNQSGGLSFGVVGADNGKYIKTSASGSNVVADLSDDAKAKLNKTYTVSSGSKNVTVTPTIVGDNTDFKITVASTGTTTSSSWNLNSGVVSTTEGTHAGDTTQNIADTKSVTMQAGKNLTVTQTNDKAGNTSVAYSLDKDISVETVTVTGQNGKDGKIGIDGKDGVDGKDGKNRVEITVEKGAKGVDGTDGHDGVNGHNGKDGMTRIVYEDKGGKQEVATLNDGLKFTGNNESTENNHKLNTLVKVQGEGTKEGTDATGAKEIQTSDGTKFESAADNIAVEADGVDKLTVKLNKNLKGLDSVTTKEIKLGDANDNISIKKDGDRITYTTNNGGTITTNKVANLADELHITPGTYEIGATNKDAAAKKDEVTLTYTDGNGVEKANTFAKIKGVANSNLSNISDDGKKVITGLGSIVEAGENVTVTSVADGTTGQTTYTVNAVTPAVYTTPDGKKLTKDKDGKFHKVGETAEYTGDIITSFENPKAAAGQTTKDGGMIVNNIGSAIKNQNPTMPAGQTATYLDKLKAAADANSNVKNAAVNVSDLHNTAEALKASELHIAPTDGGNDADKGGAASGNTNPGAATQAYKYNATTKQVELTFNDGNGKAVTGPKAVIDFSDLNIPAPTASYSFKTNADGNVDGNSTETEVASGKTVKFGAGKNLTVKQEIGTDGNHTYTYALNKDLTNLDKVVVNGKDGIDGKDGVSITGPKGESAPGAKDGQDGKVGIAGKDGKDAVSIAGKDGVGYIGLTGPAGKDGRNATADITVKDGVPGVDGQPGETMTRIVYQDKDGNEHQVATYDDGMKFAGDDGQANQDTNAQVIKKHLNNVVDIVGGADKTKLTDKNIGVNNVNGKLKVQLAK
ncbi:ESPR-type extended signal peptide-containing protein, partial [Veillonella sp. ICM51a]|uniref:ESPR-type extended signal peptide-containing protein n=1 Tax=Veillonella sp. ICM51a TaxID=936591 RepID=UPI00044B7F10